MIVCDLTHAYTPTSGGIRTYINDKRQHLLEHTEHTHVLVVPGEEDVVERGERWATWRVKGPTIPFAAPYRFFPRRSRLDAALREARPDLVELNTYYMPPEAGAAYRYRAWARAQGRTAAVAVHYHTDFAHSYAKQYTAPVLGERLSGGLERLAARYVRGILGRADAVLTFSEQHRQSIQTLGIADARLVPQFIDLDTFHPKRADPAVRERLGVEPDQLLLVYAGRFDTEKHVHVLVDALESVSPALRPALVMAGDGPLRHELEARAATSPALHLLPFQVGKEAVARLLATGDMYVTAGPHEVAAFSVVEAQACGLPTVGVEAGGLVGRVVPGTGFLGPVGDGEAMARNIERAARDREALGRRARAYVEAHYGSDRAFGAILDLYEETLQRVGQGAASPSLPSDDEARR
ncbi:MAG: glycosyltransferase [Rubricoccaceae bacterium]|nr:glycosyltransferase [Rubricoccaceae bacterium]